MAFTVVCKHVNNVAGRRRRGIFPLYYNVTVILQNQINYCAPLFLLLRCNRGTTPFDGKAGSDTG